MKLGVQGVYDEPKKMKEIRCKKCRRLLMKGDVKQVEIKCPKCGYIQNIKEEGGEFRERQNSKTTEQ